MDSMLLSRNMSEKRDLDSNSIHCEYIFHEEIGWKYLLLSKINKKNFIYKGLEDLARFYTNLTNPYLHEFFIRLSLRHMF